MRKISPLKIFCVFFKIGFIGFGGGSALIPVIEKEVVDKKQLLSKEEYDKNVVVANITPGALPVEIASGVGYLMAGFRGMFLATLGITTPGVILTVLLILSYQKYGTTVQVYMKYPIAIISVYIIFILIKYVGKVILSYQDNTRIKCLIVIGSVFFMSCGKEITKLFSLDYEPRFDLTSIQIFLISFSVIFFLSGRFTKGRTMVICVLSLLYTFFAGKKPIIESELIKNIVAFGLLICALEGVIISFKSKHFDSKNANGKRIIVIILAWMAFLIFLSLPVIGLCGLENPLLFEIRGLLSSLISFGGGDAYLTVADGLFVETGIITQQQFYEVIIPTVNVCPGSILCKTLSAVGLMFGTSLGGNVLQGFCMSLAGFAVSIFGSCLTFMIAYYLYDRLSGLSITMGIAKWIRPVVSGLLLSIVLTLALNVLSVC